MVVFLRDACGIWPIFGSKIPGIWPKIPGIWPEIPLRKIPLRGVIGQTFPGDACGRKRPKLPPWRRSNILMGKLMQFLLMEMKKKRIETRPLHFS